MISQPPNGTRYNEAIEGEPPLFGKPQTVNVPKSQEHDKGIRKQFFSEPNFRRSLTSRGSNYTSFTSEKPDVFRMKNGYRPLSDNLKSELRTPRTFDSAEYFTKPTVKETILNKQDQQSLTAQNKHLRDLLQTQTEEIMSLRNLDRENQDIVQNLKAR